METQRVLLPFRQQWYVNRRHFYSSLFTSGIGFCCGFPIDALPPPGEEYKVIVGRSLSARGPFIDDKGIDLRASGGKLILASHDTFYAPGGQAIFYDRKLRKDVFVYHYIPTDSEHPYNDIHATLGLNGIDWSSVRLCCQGRPNANPSVT